MTLVLCLGLTFQAVLCQNDRSSGGHLFQVAALLPNRVSRSRRGHQCVSLVQDNRVITHRGLGIRRLLWRESHKGLRRGGLTENHLQGEAHLCQGNLAVGPPGKVTGKGDCRQGPLIGSDVITRQLNSPAQGGE